MEPYVVPAARPDRRRWWWAAAWVVLVALIAGGAVAIADGAPTPEEQLAEVIAFVREHRTARFETESTTRIEPPPGWLGDEPFDDYHGRWTGQLDIGGRVATVTEYDGTTYEWIQLPEGAYSRATEPGERWTYYARHDIEPDWTELLEGQLEVEAAEDGDGGGSFLSGRASTGGLPDERLLELARVGTVRADGPGRLHVTYRMRDLLDPEDRALLARVRDEYFRRPFDAERTVVVEHGDDGRLDAVHEEGAGTTTVTRYAGWGLPVRIEPPPPEQVDRTPRIDEDALAAYRPGPLLVPADLPEGWALRSGHLIDRVVEDDDLDSECARADLDYGPEDWEIGASVVLIEPDCPYLDDQLDLEVGEHARIGAYDVVLHDADDFFWYGSMEGIGAAVLLPQGWLLVTTSEGEDVLARLVASLAPYDPASAATPSATVKAPS